MSLSEPISLAPPTTSSPEPWRAAPPWTAFLSDVRPVSRSAVIATFALIAVGYALLWSPNWYPLSDSALYLILGRALASGYGYSNMGEAHHMAMPLTPLLLAGVIKLGGGIGAMHAVLGALTYASHVLSFLTMRRWFKERIALFATIAGACSYWVFINTFTIYTEPLFLVVFWAALLLLSYLPQTESARQRYRILSWVLLLCVVAWFNRVAAGLLFPCILFGFWMTNTTLMTQRARVICIAVFVLIFAVLSLDYLRPPRGIKLPDPTVELPDLPNHIASIADSVGEDDHTGTHEKYTMPMLNGVMRPEIELPMLGGRWICEVLAMPSTLLFRLNGPAYWVGWLFGAATFALFLGGTVLMVVRKQWWAASFAVYLLPFWIGWGTRVKPRYLLPITPIIFVIVWAGLSVTVAWLIWKFRKHQLVNVSRVARWTGGLMLAGVVLGNAPPYIGELYIRHVRPVEFYDQARRGAFGELVDICAYLETHADPMERVWTNRGIGLNRRVISFLSGRPVQLLQRDSRVLDPDDQAQLYKYLKQVRGRYAIVYSEKFDLPEWHRPLAPVEDQSTLPWWRRVTERVIFGSPPAEPEDLSWWRLYEIDPETGFYSRINPPRSRDYVRDIPASAL